jgi:hypothetical protein
MRIANARLIKLISFELIDQREKREVMLGRLELLTAFLVPLIIGALVNILLRRRNAKRLPPGSRALRTRATRIREKAPGTLSSKWRILIGMGLNEFIVLAVITVSHIESIKLDKETVGGPLRNSY